jgi:beta-glucosidase
VLLKNESHILPINSKKIKRIAVCGPNASRFVTGGGSGWLDPFHAVTLLDGIKKIAAENNIQVDYVQPYYTPEKEFFTDKSASVQGLKAEYFSEKEPKGTPLLTRTDTKLDFDWQGGKGIEGITSKKFSIRWTGVIKPSKSTFYNFILTSNGGYKMTLNGKVLFDQPWVIQTSKAARLELKADSIYDICIESFQDNLNPNIHFEWTTIDKEELRKSFTNADLVIANIGFNFSNEMEGYDRTFQLAADEAELIDLANTSGKPIVAVVNAGGNVEMQSWYPKLSGLLWAWYPGQEGGTAIAEVLFGKVNPSGKLPATFEKKWADNPTFNSYHDDNNDKRVTYKEGIFVGYRGYDKNKTEVQFPFGYGLSYSTFELSDIKVETSKTKTAKAIVSCKIKNTSTIEGTEVVQLYIGGKPTKSQQQPIKELKGYEKVNLKTGESKTVAFQVSERDLSYFNVAKNKFVFEPSEYDFMIGTSSRDIKLEKKIKIK